MLRIEDQTVVRDRYAHPGEAPIDLDAVMTPRSWPSEFRATSFGVTGSEHWSVSGLSLDVTPEGDAADLSVGTYFLSVTASRAPFADQTATLTIICYAATRYIAPDSGSDGASGLTTETAWKHAPGEAGATDVAAAFAPTDTTLINIKGGARLKTIVMKNHCHYGSYGWGIGKPEVTGMVPLPAGVAATTGETLNNPRTANIKRYAQAITHSTPIRDGGTFAAPLAFAAQWPPAGANKFLESQEPRFHLTKGMKQIALTQITELAVVGAQRRYRITDPDIVADFPGIDLTNYTVNLWSEANHIRPALIEAWDLATSSFEFVCKPYLTPSPFVSYNLVGHPAFIGAAGQYAWNPAHTETFGEFASPIPEISSSFVTIKFDSTNTNNGISNLRVSGGHTTVASGITGGNYCGVNIDGGPVTHLVVDNDFRHTLSDLDQAASVRTHTAGTGTGKIWNWVVSRNTIEETFRSSGFRFSNSDNVGHKFTNNWMKHIGFTSYYVLNAKNVLFQSNINIDCQSAHGNVYTLYIEKRDQPYGYGADVTMRFCETRNCARPLTADFHQRLKIDRCLFEVDEWASAFQPWMDLIDMDFDQTYFALKSGTAADENKWAAFLRGTGTIDRCVFDGLIVGSAPAIYTNCLSTQRTSKSPELEDVPAPSSGNIYVQQNPWNGTSISPRRKQTLGAGWLGASFAIADVSSVSFADVVNATPGEQTMAGPSLLTSDKATVTITAPAGAQIRTSSDAAGAVVISDWGSSALNQTPGVYVWVRATANAANSTRDTYVIDLGDDNLIPWEITTKRASGWTNQVFDLTDNLQTASVPLMGAGSNSTSGTLMLAALFNVFPGSAAIIGGPTTGTIRFQMTLLPNGKLRILLKDAANVTCCNVDCGPFTAAQESTVAITFDMTKPAATGVRFSVDGGPPAYVTPTTWVQGSTIEWSFANTYKFGNSKIDGTVGAFFLDNRLADLGSPDICERLTNPLRVGTNGENVFGTAPKIFLIGASEDWNSGAGINRGSGPKFVRTAGEVTQATASATTWPAFTFASQLLIEGPSTVMAGEPTDFTVQFDGSLMNPVTVHLGGGGDGSWEHATITIPAGVNPSGSARFTAGEAGVLELAATADALLAASKALLVYHAPATAYTFELSAAFAAVGDEVEYILTLNGSNLAGISIDPGLTGFSAAFEPELFLPPGETRLVGVMRPLSPGQGQIGPISALEDPEPSAFSAVVSYRAIVAGEPMQLTDAQWRAIVQRTVAAPAGPITGPVQFRFKAGPAETGATVGVDVSYAIEWVP